MLQPFSPAKVYVTLTEIRHLGAQDGRQESGEPQADDLARYMYHKLRFCPSGELAQNVKYKMLCILPL